MISKKIVQKYLDCGVNVMPITQDKRPKTKEWKSLQEHLVKAADWDANGVGLICGKVSGNLEVIDLDQKYYKGHLLNELQKIVCLHNKKLWDKLVIQETQNGGWHLIFRCPTIEGNKKLAQREATPKEKEVGDTVKVIIETRGEGGYIATWPTKGYNIMQGRLGSIPTITEKERKLLLTLCGEFDELGDVVRKYGNEGEAPWVHYDREHNCTEELERQGWRLVYSDSHRDHFLRSGSTSSKTSGNVHRELGLFRCFSTSTPFEPDKFYTASGIRCVLEFDSDWKKCGAALAREGYGERAKEQDLSDVTSLISSHKNIHKNLREIFDGNVDVGHSIGIPEFDKYFTFRRNCFVFTLGKRGNGKTTVWLYLLAVNSWKNGAKYLIDCVEDTKETVISNLIGFALQQPAVDVYKTDRERYLKAAEWVERHFKIIDHNDDWTLPDFLDIAKKLHQIENFDGVFADPYNSYRVPNVGNTYSYHVECANKCRLFADKHTSLILSAHPATKRTREGGMPLDVDAEGGTTFPNKAHYTVVLDRDIKAIETDVRNTTKLSIDKVKAKEIYGGNETPEEAPILLVFNRINFGFNVFLPIFDGVGYNAGHFNLLTGERTI